MSENLPEPVDDDFGVEPKKLVVMDDEYLLKKEFERDPEKGCELLFKRYYTNLCNHAIRFVHSREVAEDIVSEVFSGFWQHRTFLDVTTSFRAYLYKAVRSRSYNFLKRQMMHATALEHSVEHGGNSGPDEMLQYTELHQKIESIIRDLPPRCRKAYILKRIEGKKYHEIAIELKISSKAVEALVSRALIRLREGLSPHWILLILLTMTP